MEDGRVVMEEITEAREIQTETAEEMRAAAAEAIAEDLQAAVQEMQEKIEETPGEELTAKEEDDGLDLIPLPDPPVRKKETKAHEMGVVFGGLLAAFAGLAAGILIENLIHTAARKKES